MEQRLREAQDQWARSQRESAANTAEETPEAEGEDPIQAQVVLREMERIQTAKIQLQLLDDDLKSIGERRAAVRSEMASLQASMARLPINDQELRKVVRGYDNAQQNYSSLLAKSMEAGLAQEMETRQKAEKFSTLEPARLPEKPIRPDRGMLLAITCGSGLALGCFLGFGVELRRNVILGEWEMPPEVPLLGHIPIIVVEEGGLDGDPDNDGAGIRGAGRFFPRKLVIASSLALSVLAVVATSVYFGWIPF